MFLSLVATHLTATLSALEPITGEVPTRDTNRACLNQAIISDEFEDSDVDRSRYSLLSAYVMQRHCDRWLYEHDNINNVCWPGQVNSSKASSPLMAAECAGVPSSKGSLQTVWQDFPHSPDPYAKPSSGSCQATQGSRQGKAHAEAWGAMLKKQYVDSGLIPQACPPGTVALHADKVHKNELTLETEYFALCGRLPDLHEFPRESTLVGYVAEPTKGSPWYAAAGQCKGAHLDRLSKEAKDSMLESQWWKESVEPLAAEVAAATGKTVPESSQAAQLLSSITDCVTVHACTGLRDSPAAFLDPSTGLPSIEDPSALFARMSRRVTATWTWAFEYFRATDLAKYFEYASLYYGYFLAVLNDQLSAAAQGDPRVPKLTITVMSCDNISPQLALYGLQREATWWPPYLSALIHEVYKDEHTGDFLVRVLFDGHVVRVCANPGSFPLCPMNEWRAIVQQFTPSKESCPALYSGYDFLSSVPLTNAGDASSLFGLTQTTVPFQSLLAFGVCITTLISCAAMSKFGIGVWQHQRRLRSISQFAQPLMSTGD